MNDQIVTLEEQVVQAVREAVARLLERGRELLCPTCFQEVFTQATCSECGAVYSEHAQAVADSTRTGRPLLCPKCRSRRRLDVTHRG